MSFIAHPSSRRDLNPGKEGIAESFGAVDLLLSFSP